MNNGVAVNGSSRTASRTATSSRTASRASSVFSTNTIPRTASVSTVSSTRDPNRERDRRESYAPRSVTGDGLGVTPRASGSGSTASRRTLSVRTRAEDAFQSEPATTTTPTGPPHSASSAVLPRRLEPNITTNHVAVSHSRVLIEAEEAGNVSSFIQEASFARAPLNSRITPLLPSTTTAREGGGGAKINGSSKGKGKSRAEDDELKRAPVEVQEALILDDLLHVLMGIEGTYITYPPNYAPSEKEMLQGVHFVVSPSLDPSLADLVERVLPLGTYYTALSAFIAQRSSLDYGLVNHALCAAIRDMLKDYTTLLTQLEYAFLTNPTFSLQKLWFYIHPTMHTLSLLFSLTSDLSLSPTDSSSPRSSDNEDEDEDDDADDSDAEKNAALGLGNIKNIIAGLSDTGSSSSGPIIGGEVISILHDRRTRSSGDPSARALYGKLLALAGRPYVKALRGWVSTGKLEDAYGEVCIKESQIAVPLPSSSTSNVYASGDANEDYADDAWERKYTLRDGSAPGPPGVAKRQPGVPNPRAGSGRLPGGACVPPMLERWKVKVLVAGKYWNVIRDVGGGKDDDDDDDDDEVGGDDLNVGEEVSLDDDRLYTTIEDAYTLANRTLLHLLLHDQQLIPRLRVLRRTFFLARGAYATHWLDLANYELRKSARAASASKLQSLLEIALAGVPAAEAAGLHLGSAANLGTSTSSGISAGGAGSGGGTPGAVAEWRWKEDVRVVLSTSTVYDWLAQVLKISGAVDEPATGAAAPDEPISTKDSQSGSSKAGEGGKDKDKGDKEKEKSLAAIDALTLDTRVPFPLSLVISRRTVVRYQFLFRFLLHLKHVESQLCGMWIEHKSGPWRARLPLPPGHVPSAPNQGRSGAEALEVWRRRVFVLRAKMLAFVQHVLAFAAQDVLEPHSRALETALAGAKTVDGLLRAHVDFLDTCLKGCMLTTVKLLEAHQRMMKTCATFAVYAASFTKSAGQARDAVVRGDVDTEMPSRIKFLAKFETNFDYWLSAYLDRVRYYASSDNVALLPLVVRLNSITS